MYSATLSVNLSAIREHAARLAVALPADLAAVYDHYDTLAERGSTPAYDLTAAVDDMTAHLGDPAALDKARAAAVKRLAVAQVEATLDALVSDASLPQAWQATHEHADALVSAFADALAPRLADAQAAAEALPEHIMIERLATLDGETYKGYRDFERLVTDLDLDRLLNALAPLYLMPDLPEFSPRAKLRLALLEPTTLHARTLAEALEGVTGATSGPLSPATEVKTDPWVAAAHHGTLSLATPTQHAERAQTIAEAHAASPWVTIPGLQTA